MKAIRTLSPLAILFAATALSTPPLAAPATGPSRYFTGADLFNLEVATDPADQPRRPDHRLRPQVQRHHDRQGALDDLAGRRRHRPAAPARSPAPAPISRRAGRPTAPASLMSPPKAAARSSTCAGWQAAKARGSPACPTAPTAIAWSPDGRRIAYSMFVPDDGAKLGKAPRQARGRQMGRPARRSSTRSPTAPTAPAI